MPRAEQSSGELPRLLLGMQSGTSADGVDLALLRVRGLGRERRAEVIAGARMPMPAELQRNARASDTWSLAALAAADHHSRSTGERDDAHRVRDDPRSLDR